jgi:hypothetical protein
MCPVDDIDESPRAGSNTGVSLTERRCPLVGCIDLRGCEYLGGCPTIGTKVLSKVELHFTDNGLSVAITPQGLFTLATAHPVLTLTWAEITNLALKQAHPGRPPATALKAVRSARNILTMRLDLPYQLAVQTAAWTMNLGVRAEPKELARQLQQLIDRCGEPRPQLTTA